jgi:AcrR family transcriptional regulator
MIDDALQTGDGRSLQEAKKAFARARICDAARDLFYRQGYAATTFEQIATAAGTRRTTLYSHYRDKAEILEAIGDEYHEGLRQLAAALPGPIPSRPEIDRWIAQLVDYVTQQRTPATLLIGLGIGADKPAAIEKWSGGFLGALADHIPAFQKAIAKGKEAQLASAWARVVIRELSLCCLEAARDPKAARTILGVAADLFSRFVEDFA